MFIGAIPKKISEQIVRSINFSKWGDVYVGCSGSFRIEQAIRERHPNVRIFSNDVSALSCAIGAAATGKDFPINFINDLECLSRLHDGSAVSAVAAIEIAITLSKYKGNNEFSRARKTAIISNLDLIYKGQKERAAKFLESIKINGFYSGDFIKQIERARKNGGGVITFAPTYKAGYERIYKYLNDNIKWNNPEYAIWNPDASESMIEDLFKSGMNFGFLSDQKLDFPITAAFFPANNKGVYVYSNENNVSIRADKRKEAHFRYHPIDAGKIYHGSVVQIAEISSDRMNFLKNVYLSKGINHTSGMANFIVLIDGMLAGGFIYAISGHIDKTSSLYLLSDFSTSRNRRLSKLIPMLATSSSILNMLGKRWMIEPKYVSTTAFTTKPVSMKYRGIFDLYSRKENFLNYTSKPRNATPQEIFKTWYKKYANQNANSQAQTERTKTS